MGKHPKEETNDDVSVDSRSRRKKEKKHKKEKKRKSKDKEKSLSSSSVKKEKKKRKRSHSDGSVKEEEELVEQHQQQQHQQKQQQQQQPPPPPPSPPLSLNQNQKQNHNEANKELEGYEPTRSQTQTEATNNRNSDDTQKQQDKPMTLTNGQDRPTTTTTTNAVVLPPTRTLHQTAVDDDDDDDNDGKEVTLRLEAGRSTLVCFPNGVPDPIYQRPTFDPLTLKGEDDVFVYDPIMTSDGASASATTTTRSNHARSQPQPKPNVNVPTTTYVVGLYDKRTRTVRLQRTASVFSSSSSSSSSSMEIPVLTQTLRKDALIQTETNTLGNRRPGSLEGLTEQEKRGVLLDAFANRMSKRKLAKYQKERDANGGGANVKYDEADMGAISRQLTAKHGLDKAKEALSSHGKSATERNYEAARLAFLPRHDPHAELAHHVYDPSRFFEDHPRDVWNFICEYVDFECRNAEDWREALCRGVTRDEATWLEGPLRSLDVDDPFESEAQVERVRCAILLKFLVVFHRAVSQTTRKGPVRLPTIPRSVPRPVADCFLQSFAAAVAAKPGASNSPHGKHGRSASTPPDQPEQDPPKQPQPLQGYTVTSTLRNKLYIHILIVYVRCHGREMTAGDVRKMSDAVGIDLKTATNLLKQAGFATVRKRIHHDHDHEYDANVDGSGGGDTLAVHLPLPLKLPPMPRRRGGGGGGTPMKKR